MGERQQPATMPVAVEDAVLPAGAQAPSASTARELLADVSPSSAYGVASVIHQHPRHKAVILEYVAAEAGNRVINEILAELKELDKTSTTSDHVRAQDEDDLATKGGGDALGEAPDPAKRLPYTKKGGWDAIAINSKLGQADQLAGTDSDGARCAFAVALAGQIFGGPDAVASWLVEYLNAHKPSSQMKMTPRRQAAWTTILRIASAVGGRTATYGDLSWAQEAMHAFTIDAEDGGASEASDVLVPELEQFTGLDGVEAGLDEQKAAKADANNVGKVCHSAAGLFDEILALAPGQRLLVVLKVVPVATGALYAHQIMISNHEGARYLYDPEARSGSHLTEATEANIEKLYDPDFSLSTIAVVQGRVDPKR